MKNKLVVFSLMLAVFLSFSLAEPASSQKGKGGGTGLNFAPKKLAKSFSSSGPNFSSNRLPRKVDLSPNLPTPRSQGSQGSCVGWATAFAYKTFHEKVERKWSLNQENHLFSPAYVYNQINGGRDGGSSIATALQLIKTQGVASLATMPYNSRDYRTQPSQKARREASQYRAASWSRINTQSLSEMKKILAGKNGIVIGMKIYENFYRYRGGIYSGASGGYRGGHAMLIVGYDDSNQTFKIQNSWGTWWGEGGYLRIRYSAFQKLCKYGYVMHDSVSGKPTYTPDAPANVSASKGAYNDKIRIMWDKVNNADTYSIYSLYGMRARLLATVSDTEYFHTGIRAGRNYEYLIKANNRNGSSGYSPAVKGYAKVQTVVRRTRRTTTTVTRTVSKPGQPQNIRAWNKNNTVNISWNKVDGAVGYTVFRFNMKNQDFRILSRTSNTVLQDSSVKAGESYWYTVTAYNSKGVGNASNSYNIQIPKEERVPAPSTPSYVSASSGKYDDRVELRWGNSQNAQFYLVYKWDNFKFKLLQKVSGTRLLDSNVTQDKVYLYYVKAGNESGYSQQSGITSGFASSFASSANQAKSVEFKQENNSHSEKAIQKVFTRPNNKAIFKAVRPIYDNKGKKFLDVFYYTENYTAEKGIYQSVAYYDAKGKFIKVEYLYSSAYTSQKGITRKVIYYNKSLNNVLKVETFYSEDSGKKYFKRSTFYDNKGNILKSEGLLSKDYAKSKGFYRIVVFHKKNLKIFHVELYDANDNKIVEK